VKRRSARNPTMLPTGKSEWAQHYVIDASDPPTIREVIDAYANSNAQARQPFNDDGDLLPMAHYTLGEVMRDVRPGNYLRYSHATPKFRALKGQLRRYGQRVPLMIEVDRKGVAQVGEGNHRVAALLAMYGPSHRVGVRFVFNRYPITTHAGLTWETADRDAVARRSERNGAPSPYTDPALRDAIKRRITAGSKGGKPGQWSARKAQLVAAEYAAAGGGYRSGSRTAAQRSLRKWTGEKWTTSDGKPAIRKGGTVRYLPQSAWATLTPTQRAATNRKKRAGSQAGQQFVKNTRAAARAGKAARSRRR
jgi:hypothetical protein